MKANVDKILNIHFLTRSSVSFVFTKTYQELAINWRLKDDQNSLNKMTKIQIEVYTEFAFINMARPPVIRNTLSLISEITDETNKLLNVFDIQKLNIVIN